MARAMEHCHRSWWKRPPFWFIGTLMEPLRWRVLAAVLFAAAGFTLILDQVKLPVRSAFTVG